MTAYSYRAARSDGGIVAGVVDATTQGAAGEVLVGRGLFPLTLAVTDEAERRPAANRRDLAIAFQSIAALVGAGVPLERALGATEPLTRGALRNALALARTRLREGWSLAQALAASHGVVPAVVLGMVRAGERGSQVARALNQVAAHLEQEADLIGRVRQALAYPLVLAFAGIVSVLVIGTIVVPKFADLLQDMGQALPLATRLLLGSSRLLTRFWLLLLLLGVMGIAGGVATLHRPLARQKVHELLFGLPLIGSVRRALASARVARALGGMLSAGMPLLAALEAAREAAGDDAVAARLIRARERVAEGAGLATSLEREQALAPTALQLVAVGETSGCLGEMALRAGDLAAQEAERGLKTLVTLLEPALIVAFGALVAFVAAALLQAVYSLRPGGA